MARLNPITHWVYPYCSGGAGWIIVCGSALAILLLPIRSNPAWGQEAKQGTVGGQEVELPVTRDTWVSSVEGEREANLGGASRLKTKGIQELAIVDVDPIALKGRVVLGATLRLHCRSKDPQRRLTISTLASPWAEGTSTSYRSHPGSASFLWSMQGQKHWAYPGSDITAVINGRGNTIWGFADCTAPDARGWQSVAVRPEVVAARVAGISHGFVIFDDVGCEYIRRGEQFIYRSFPNRFVASREAGRSFRPYMTVCLGEEDRQPPMAVEDIEQVDTPEPLPSGQAVCRWVTPLDMGPAGTIGFLVRVSEKKPFNWDHASEVSRYLVPMAAGPGEPVMMRLRDLGLEPGSTVSVAVRPVDAAGNVGQVAVGQIRLSGFATPNPLSRVAVPAKPFEDIGPLPRVGDLEMFVVDPLDKVHPLSGRMIPKPRDDRYQRANHLWSADKKLIRLYTAKNEFVAFQVVLEGRADWLRVDLVFDDRRSAPLNTTLYRFGQVKTALGPLPDPLVSLAGPIQIPPKTQDIEGQEFTPLLAEIYVPHHVQPGVHEGTLRLTTQAGSTRVKVRLHVWGFTLPDVLSFIPQMNCYGLPGPPVERAYYRLAHVHRTCLNRLPYNWRGEVRGGHAPDRRGNRWNWTRFDSRFGPLFDGSAFADLPRKGVPIEAFYLPINENWPMDIDRAFKGSYWVDEAFDPWYRQQFKDACGRFAQHFRDNGWTDTFFEFYLNNKVFFKRPGWSRCSAPWVFDEPVNTQDFWALRWYGKAFHEGVTPVRGGVKMVYRCDISRPQWQRDLLDGLLDVNVVSGAMRAYPRVVMDAKDRWGQVVYEYGGSNGVHQSNVQPAAWCIDAWCLGAHGVVPWQTVGNPASWQQGDALSLFYPGQPIGHDKPIASVRLKAYRRGQQDVEYLTILAQSLDLPRWAIGQAVRRHLGLEARFEKKNEIDAGMVGYVNLSPADLWALRLRVGAILDELDPPFKQRWVEIKTPAREVSSLPTLGHFGESSDTGTD